MTFVHAGFTHAQNLADLRLALFQKIEKKDNITQFRRYAVQCSRQCRIMYGDEFAVYGEGIRVRFIGVMDGDCCNLLRGQMARDFSLLA